MREEISKNICGFIIAAGSILLPLRSPIASVYAAAPSTQAAEAKPSQLLWQNEEDSDGVLGVAFSPDGKWVASGSRDGTAHIFDAQTGAVKSVLQGHTKGITEVQFSGDSSRVFTGGIDGDIRVWQTETGDLIAKLHQPYHVHSLAVSSDGKRAASAACVEDVVRIWDVDGERELHSFKTRTIAWSLAFSHDGKQLLVGTGPRYEQEPPGANVDIYDVKSGKLLHDIAINKLYPASLHFSADDSQIYVGKWNGTVELYDAATYALRSTMTYDGGLMVSLDGADKCFISSDPQGIASRDFSTGKLLSLFPILKADDAALSQDGRFAAIGYGGVGNEFDDERWFRSDINGTLVWKLSAPSALPITLVPKGIRLNARIPADGKTVVIGTDVDAVEVFDATTGQRISHAKISLLDKWAMSPDGKWGATLDERPAHGVPIFSLADGKPAVRIRFKINTDRKKQELGEALAFTPDSSGLFISFRKPGFKPPLDVNVRGLYLFDRETGKQVMDFNCPHHIFRLGVSDDGKWLAGWMTTEDQADTYTATDIVCWEVASGKQLYDLPVKSDLWCPAPAISTLGVLAVASFQDVTLYDVHDGKKLLTLERAASAVEGVFFAPDGKSLVTDTDAGLLTRWDAATGKRLARAMAPAGSHPQIRFNSDNTVTLVTGDKGIILMKLSL